jgi:hypothetical protein
MMVLHEQIAIKEYLEDSWSSWFDGLTISHAADGTTTLTEPVRDQTSRMSRSRNHSSGWNTFST